MALLLRDQGARPGSGDLGLDVRSFQGHLLLSEARTGHEIPRPAKPPSGHRLAHCADNRKSKSAPQRREGREGLVGWEVRPRACDCPAGPPPKKLRALRAFAVRFECL